MKGYLQRLFAYTRVKRCSAKLTTRIIGSKKKIKGQLDVYFEPFWIVYILGSGFTVGSWNYPTLTPARMRCWS